MRKRPMLNQLLTLGYQYIDMRLLIIAILFFPFVCSAQFWYDAENAPASKYLTSAQGGSATQLSDAIQVNRSNGSFSLAMWMNDGIGTCNAFAFGTDQVEVEILSTSGARDKVRFSIKDSIVIEGDTHNTSFSDRIQVSRANYHIAVTYDGTGTWEGMNIYINGNQIGRDSVLNRPISVLNPDTLKIGGAGCQFAWYNFRSYDFELSASQVNTLYSDVSADLTGSNPAFEILGSEKYRGGGFPYNQKKQYNNANGRVIVTNFWGGEREENQSYAYSSPTVSYFFGPRIIRASNGKYYIPTIGRGGPGYNRDNYIYSYDPDTDIFKFETHIPSLQPLNRDQHHFSSIIETKDSNLLFARTNLHNTPFIIYKTPLASPTLLDSTSIAAEGERYAYANLFHLDTTLHISAREITEWRVMVSSNDDGETWGSGLRVSENAPNEWNYGSIFMDGDSVAYLLGFIRNQTAAGNWKWQYLLQSRDGDNWCTIDSSLCKDVTSTQFSNSELFQYALIDSVAGTSQSLSGGRTVDTSGRVHLINFDGDVSKNIHMMYTPGSGWTYDTLSVASPNDRFALYYKGDNSFDMWTRGSVGGKASVLKYTTDDNFQTLDGPEVIYQHPTMDHPYGVISVMGPENVNLSNPGPVIIVATIETDRSTEQTGLFIYEYNPWE
jgi:hypothetical protein